MASSKKVAIIGAGVFGLSLALALRRRGHQVTVFDQHRYDETRYQPNDAELVASADHNKIFRCSYGTKLHYQRLATESREAWLSIDKERGGTDDQLFVPSGMLRVQPSSTLSELEKETLANMERDGFRDTQFIKSDPGDYQRAAVQGWHEKLLSFEIPDSPNHTSFEAVLDSLAGFTRCANACAHFQKLAESEGVEFVFGAREGSFASILSEKTAQYSAEVPAKKKAVGIQTQDGRNHRADVVVVAAGAFSTQILPELSYHLESSAGSLATFKIDPSDTHLWTKYSPEKFPVMTWKSVPRTKDGKDTGSVYVLPRTPEGLLKIGYRGIKYTNFQPAPDSTPFSQDGKWSIPLPPSECTSLQESARHAIRHFVTIFLPEFKDMPFCAEKLCWYTDTLDNSFLIDYVPAYAENSVFVSTGGSGHGAKFMPVLGEHAADVFEHRDQSTTPMRPFWRWREDITRRNGLEEGPAGPRNIAS
ncbi:Putative FAD dependent oxidoreductase, FAD/NAD(P)-binding domain superfamily, MTOX family [Septoria linicola]|uniref:FAD dependent oxidoreductase, FAD/NAD(P)-binding domain superfamily, MTOX family n=1 Tax=Septoria linicola TaxID=215465 RepID=A0A9Q9B072_9PEZI|nr:Putative FAD dependent oxidoreductase, FAD/NAD(P)-binding domain superfamily, MTOX family [Septoria linicola]